MESSLAFLKTIVEQLSSQKIRSTVLQSLQWQTPIFVIGAIAAAETAGTDALITKVLLGMMILDFFFFRGAYLYFAVKDRSLLHTEHFRLSQMTLENERTGYKNFSDQPELYSENIEELVNGDTIFLNLQPIKEKNINIILNDQSTFILKNNGKIKYRLGRQKLII